MNVFERLALRESSIDVQQNVPLDKYTTLRVGGPADYFAEPASEAELMCLLDAAKEAGDKVGLSFGPDDIHVMHKAVTEA